MKKFLVLFLSMSFVLVSCNKDLESEISNLKKQLNDYEVSSDVLENKIEGLSSDLLKYENELIEKDELIKANEEEIQNLMDEVKAANRESLSSGFKLDNLKKDNDLFQEYFVYEEDLKEISRNDINDLLQVFLTANKKRLVYTEYDYFRVDYNGEDPIHQDPIFTDQLEWYRLVTQFDQPSDMQVYFNQWFSEELAWDLFNQLVGSVEDQKKYVIYKDKLFTQPGDMGYSTPYFYASQCKCKVTQSKEEKIVMHVLIPFLEDDYEYTYVQVKEYALEFIKEADGWKLNKDICLSDIED